MSSHHDRSHDRTPSKSHSHSKKHKSKRREAESLQERIKAFGYSNTDNPFNDPHLDEPFVWKLKEAESSRTSRSRQKELGTVVNAARQLEALVKQRRKREDVRQRKNEEYQKPVMRGDDWAVKEDQFHLDQIMERAAIRMRQDRPLPIDKICMPFCILQDPALGVELGRWCLDIIEMPPYELLDALNDTDLETVGKDVHSFVEFGKRGPELDFWIEMETVIKAITTKRQMQMQGAARIGVTASVAHDIDTMLEPKSFEQLIVLEEQILAKLNGIGGPIDVDYWEAVMDALVVWKAKSMIRAMHGVRYRQVVDLVEPMLKNQVRKDNDKQETVGPSKIEQVFLKEAAKSVEKDEQPFLNPPDKVPFVCLTNSGLFALACKARAY